jgi:hypothetical protein
MGVQKKYFGIVKNARISLYQFFTTSLIKKGGGLWPDDTLATSSTHCVENWC